MTVALEELSPGASLPPFTRTIESDYIKSRGGKMEELWGMPVSGKNIHNDTETARSYGARDVVVGGVVTMGLGWEMLLNAFGDRWLRGGKLSCTFINMVCGGDEITVNGVVKEPAPDAPADRVYLDIWLENQEGDKVIVGKASIPTG